MQEIGERAYSIALDVMCNPVLESWTFSRTELEELVRRIVLDCSRIVEYTPEYFPEQSTPEWSNACKTASLKILSEYGVKQNGV